MEPKSGSSLSFMNISKTVIKIAKYIHGSLYHTQWKEGEKPKGRGKS